jgi:hypothetical protein
MSQVSEDQVIDWILMNPDASHKVISALKSTFNGGLSPVLLKVASPRMTKRNHSTEVRKNLLSEDDGAKTCKESPIEMAASAKIMAEISNAQKNALTIGEFDLKAILKSIFQIVTKLVAADRCSIFLVDKLTNELYTFAFDITSSRKKSDSLEVPTVPEMSLERADSFVSSPSGQRRPKPKRKEKKRSQMMKDYGYIY